MCRVKSNRHKRPCQRELCPLTNECLWVSVAGRNQDMVPAIKQRDAHSNDEFSFSRFAGSLRFSWNGRRMRFDSNAKCIRTELRPKDGGQAHTNESGTNLSSYSRGIWRREHVLRHARANVLGVCPTNHIFENNVPNFICFSHWNLEKGITRTDS